MKDLYNLDPKAYKEVYTIIKMLDESKQNLIPTEIVNYIVSHMDSSHTISNDDIKKNNLLSDTNLLLAALFKSFIANDEEKRIINAKERSIELKKQKEALKKYNPNNLFKK